MKFSNFTKNKIIKIKLSDITTLPELANAFHIDDGVKNRIKEDMNSNGFSKSHPIHIFKWKGKWVLCDGHTRFAAAKECNLKYVYTEVHDFKNLNEALLYSYKEQFDRRNTEDSELFKEYILLKNQNMSVEEISDKLHKSKRHVFKLQKIFNEASPKQKQAILEQKQSINAIHNEIIKKESEAKKKEIEIQNKIKKEKELENFSEKIVVPESIEVESNIEMQVQKTQFAKQRELDNREAELKQRELELNSQLTDKDILILGIKFALIETAKGRKPNEILNDSRLTDCLSFKKEDLELIGIN